MIATAINGLLKTARFTGVDLLNGAVRNQDGRRMLRSFGFGGRYCASLGLCFYFSSILVNLVVFPVYVCWRSELVFVCFAWVVEDRCRFVEIDDLRSRWTSNIMTLVF